MGTSGAWDGSGGRAWGRVRRDTGTFTENPTADGAEALLPQLSIAMDWLDGDTGPDGDGQQDVDTADGDDSTPVHDWGRPLPIGRPATSHGSGGNGGGAGGGGGGAVQGRRSGRGGGGIRSRAAAAGVGSRVLAAGLAYERGDRDTLNALGLNLDELRSLSQFNRMNAILNALVGADGGIAESELRVVNGRVLRQIFKEGLNGAEAVRLYIVELIVQAWASETGRQSRRGDTPQTNAEAERQLRSALNARTLKLQLSESLTTTAALRKAIYDGLGLMRKLMKTKPSRRDAA